ncbi:MAG: hypothetical protein ACRC4H_00960 [Plesiomonas sp.]|uniref:hypothetical protein n=1 Tax=Plesiomonas sp. TaxID=2486279 RepID=UPI003EE74396
MANDIAGFQHKEKNAVPVTLNKRAGCICGRQFSKNLQYKNSAVKPALVLPFKISLLFGMNSKAGRFSQKNVVKK